MLVLVQETDRLTVRHRFTCLTGPMPAEAGRGRGYTRVRLSIVTSDWWIINVRSVDAGTGFAVLVLQNR